MKNIFWAVYNKRKKLISLSEDKRIAQEEALRKSKYRWTVQTFEKDWAYLVSDGYFCVKSIVHPYDIKSG